MLKPLTPVDSLPVIVGATVTADYNFLTAATGFQRGSAYASCDAAVQRSLKLVYMDATKLPLGNISTSCLPSTSQRRNQRRLNVDGVSYG